MIKGGKINIKKGKNPFTNNNGLIITVAAAIIGNNNNKHNGKTTDSRGSWQN